MKKSLLFDMDGTLYPLEKDDFYKTELYLKIENNTIFYLKEKLSLTEKEAENCYLKIKEKYPRLYSFGLNKEYGINKEEYLNFCWNFNPSKFVKKLFNPKEVIKYLNKDYQTILVSDAPLIWVNNVKEYLDMNNLFNETFSGAQLCLRKKEGLFDLIVRSLGLNPKDSYVIGDEEENDILPAKNLGLHTFYVGLKEFSSSEFKIKNITELTKYL
ncbi:HAD family hydrolase [Candidatus Woesearchaeota archaeon]|nr:HAD family hydrolase [Candidatus Woesearchaeota archaeon]